MLYSLLSPLVFFASLSGIIFIIARVVARMRKAELSASIAHAASSDSNQFTWQLAPDEKKVQLVKTRLGMVGQLFKRMRPTILSKEKAVASVSALSESVAPMMHKYTRAAATLASRSATSAKTITSLMSKKIAARRKTKPQAAQVPEPASITPDALKEKAKKTAKKPILSLRQEMPPAPPEPPLAKTMPGKLVSPLLFKKVAIPAQLQTAQQALEDSDYKKAENILVPYLVKHARDTAAYMMLGRVALGQQNWTDAMEIFDQVVTLNNKERDVYALLGYAAYRCGKRTRALEALQRAQEIDPGNEEVLKHLLIIAHQMDNAALEHSIEEKLKNLHAQVPA